MLAVERPSGTTLARVAHFVASMAAHGEGGEIIPAVLLVLFLLACLIHAAVTCGRPADEKTVSLQVPVRFH